MSNTSACLSLVGQVLIQNCFGQNELILRFSGNDYVTIFTDNLVVKGEQIDPNVAFSERVNRLLGSEVSLVSLSDFSLLIKFRNETEIYVEKDDLGGESVTLNVGSEVIVL